MEKNSMDSIFIGLALGAVFPVIGFIMTETIFGLLTDMNLMEQAGTGVYSKRTRTVALIAICFTLIPFNFSKRRRWDDTMRGIIFPTLLYVGLWLYKYQGVLNFLN